VTADELGFIGLGNMGGPMAGRLVEAGYRLVGYDVAGTEERLPRGARAAPSTEDVARSADVLFLSLPSRAISRSVCAEVAAAPGRRTHTVIDLSTIGIQAACDCAAQLREAAITYVDAPVSGGVAGARSGSLAMMVGAPRDVFEALDPLLQPIARHRFHMGEAPGQGQAMKLLNNLVSATSLAITSEAVVFGARAGLDLAQVVDVLNVSSGRTTASTDKFPRSVLPRTYDFGFTGAMMAKDVTLYLESAEATAVPRCLAACVAALWQRFNAAHPQADFTYIHRYFEEGGT
jgi:3-hydroxyisobutyrate dehydrogenase